MSYQYRYCPTCNTTRVAFGYQCSVCGGPVRHSDHASATHTADDPGQHSPFASDWHTVTRADAENAAREAVAA